MTDHSYWILKEQEAVPVLSLEEWGAFFQDTEKRRVALTYLTNKVWISTVFLGLDHSFGGPVPLLFETMTFGGPRDGEQWRAATWQEAEAWHWLGVLRSREAMARRLCKRTSDRVKLKRKSSGSPRLMGILFK